MNNQYLENQYYRDYIHYRDPNAIRRMSKLLKSYLRHQEIVEQEMDKLQIKLDKLEWTEENWIARKALYKEQAVLLSKFRMNRIQIKWSKIKMKHLNITG